MALRGINQLLKKQAIGYTAPCASFHDLPPDSYVSRPNVGNVKRGRGGRSSFSGTVATIFGANGFLGKVVVNQLGKCGTQMIVPYRCRTLYINPIKPLGDLGQIVLTEANLRNEDDIRRVIKYSNVVVNLVGTYHDTKNYKMAEVNIDIPRNIARISQEMGIERFIHVSHINAGVDFKPRYLKNGSEYLRTKTAGEKAVLEEHPDATIVRPSRLFGYKDLFFRYYSSLSRRSLNSISLPNYGKGIYIQPVHVGDVARGIDKLIFMPEAKGQIFEAVGPRRYELCDAVQYINDLVGRNEERGYTVTNLDYNIFMQMKARILGSHPMGPIVGVCLENLEMDSHSHMTRGLPTLEDLGLALEKIEDHAEINTMPRRIDEFYKEVDVNLRKYRLPKYAVPRSVTI